MTPFDESPAVLNENGWPVGWDVEPWAYYRNLYVQQRLGVHVDGGVLLSGTNIVRVRWPGGSRFLRVFPGTWRMQVIVIGREPKRRRTRRLVDQLWQTLVASFMHTLDAALRREGM